VNHEGTAAQPVGETGVAGTRTGGGDADAPALRDDAVSAQQAAEALDPDRASDVEAQVDELLSDVAGRPLREQVDVFESVHAVLTDRLSEKDA
jgi:hypothetical protein